MRQGGIAATFTSVIFELMKQGFSYYSQVADYSSVYGNLQFLLILILCIYYASVVFILGGEVGQVATMQRIRKRQRERLFVRASDLKTATAGDQPPSTA